MRSPRYSTSRVPAGMGTRAYTPRPWMAERRMASRSRTVRSGLGIARLYRPGLRAQGLGRADGERERGGTRLSGAAPHGNPVTGLAQERQEAGLNLTDA